MLLPVHWICRDPICADVWPHDQLLRGVARLIGFARYFFYGFMARHIELWRPSVDSARHECYGTCLAICTGLVDQLCPAFPRMASAVHDTIAAWLEDNGDSVMQRINEVFKQEADPFVSHDELATAILKVSGGVRWWCHWSSHLT